MRLTARQWATVDATMDNAAQAAIDRYEDEALPGRASAKRAGYRSRGSVRCGGNAATDGDPYRGWLLGHFIDPNDGMRKTEALEIE